MSKYFVSYEVIYTDVVEADSPEEAADIVMDQCPYSIDSLAHVVRINTDEEWDI